MKNKFLLHVLMWSRYVLFGFILQCLLFTFLLANNGNAQVKSIKQVLIELHIKDAPLKAAFEAIEGKTEFNFVFAKEEIADDVLITIKAKNKSVAEILKKISRKADLQFQQVNKSISVKRISKSNNSDYPVTTNIDPIIVSGKVTSQADGSALPGVNIIVKGTTHGTVTDIDGNYSIEVPDQNTVLIFSFIGYNTREIGVNGRAVIDVALANDVQALQEVVVIGYGAQEKKNITSAVTTVSSQDFLQGAFNNPIQMIQGKVSGVSISNAASADPNSSAVISIRGSSSIEAGNGPLIVIDGMPGGDLRNLSQQDIASITVLKDGSSAAIYGSRGANGVILIQTKKGKAGKVSVTYDSYVEHDVVAAKPDILSPDEFLEHEIAEDQGARTDWYDELIREDNMGQNHYLAVSGGNDNSLFRISGNYRTKTAIDIASERKEYGLRASFQQKALEGLLEFGGNINYRVAQEEYTNYGVFQQAVKLNPTLPVMDPDNPEQYNLLFGYDTYNPVQDLMTRENGADQTYSIIDLNAKLNILPNLNTELKLARQSHDEYRREYYSSESKESIDNDRTERARLENEKWTDWTLEWIGNYFTSIGKHDFSIMGGYSYQEFNNHAFWAENADFPSDAFDYNNLDGGQWNLEKGRLGMDSWKSKEKTIAFFGRLNYSFNDTYLFTGTLRYEGNTKFGADNKWGLFPAASAAWRISNLSAFDNVGLINDLKLRVSYGETGRSGFARYSSLARYTGFGKYLNEAGEWIQVYGPANNPNFDLRWEKQITYNVGLDFTILNGKVNGNFDAFMREGKDVISNYDVPVPPYLHDQLFTNVASTSAKGLELSLEWAVVDHDDFNYTTSITGTYIKSKLDKFSSGTFQKGFMDRYNLPSPGNPGPAQRLEEGTEIGSFYGYRYAGVDDDGNILIWKNAEVGSEKILATDEGDPNRDRAYIGNGAPRYELSWGNSFTYKQFDLSLFFHGRFDYQILNLYQMYYGLTAEPGVNLLKDAYGRNAHIKSGKVITDYFLENGDYFKLDNLTLGWSPNLSSKWISNFRIYGTVRNVFTLTNYTGLDPSTVDLGRASGLEPGIGDLNVYPVTRNYALGAQITF